MASESKRPKEQTVSLALVNTTHFTLLVKHKNIYDGVKESLEIPPGLTYLIPTTISYFRCGLKGYSHPSLDEGQHPVGHPRYRAWGNWVLDELVMESCKTLTTEEWSFPLIRTENPRKIRHILTYVVEHWGYIDGAVKLLVTAKITR